MSKQLDWNAYRYVLDDPTLDREAFEARMLDDVELALAVAEAMSHVDALQAASFVAPPLAQSASSNRSGQSSRVGEWHLISLAVLAATLLLAVGVVNYRITNGLPRDTAQSRVGEQSLAESWLALRQSELVDASTNLVDVSTNLDPLRDEDPTTEGLEPAEDDWLMDAAHEFYAQREAS